MKEATTASYGEIDSTSSIELGRASIDRAMSDRERALLRRERERGPIRTFSSSFSFN